MSLTLRYFFNKITRFRRIPDAAIQSHDTFSAKSHEVRRDWYLVHASAKVLERWRSTHDRTILLWDRPTQKCRGARVHQARQRRFCRERSPGERILRA